MKKNVLLKYAATDESIKQYFGEMPESRLIATSINLEWDYKLDISMIEGNDDNHFIIEISTEKLDIAGNDNMPVVMKLLLNEEDFILDFGKITKAVRKMDKKPEQFK
jgi:hypothetical protein